MEVHEELMKMQEEALNPGGLVLYLKYMGL